MSAKAPDNGFATVLTAGLGPLLSSGKYSDLTVHCEDNTWNVHKMVMCTHSKFFVKACDGKFMEAKSGEIILAGDEPLVVEAMLQALYEGDYVEIEEKEEFLENPLVFHAKVYAIGEKYDIVPLKDLAKTKTENILTLEWTPTCFFAAANEAYQSTIPKDRGLRDIYAQVAIAQGPKLFANKEFEEVMDQNAQFWRDCAKGLNEKYTPFMGQTLVNCQNCRNKYSTSMFKPGYNPNKGTCCPVCNSMNYSAGALAT